MMDFDALQDATTATLFPGTHFLNFKYTNKKTIFLKGA